VGMVGVRRCVEFDFTHGLLLQEFTSRKLRLKATFNFNVAFDAEHQ